MGYSVSSATGVQQEKKENVKPEEGRLKDRSVMRVVLSTLCSPLLAVVALVVSVATHLFIVCIKPLHFLIPKQYAERVDQSVLSPLFRMAVWSSEKIIDATSPITRLVKGEGVENRMRGSFTRFYTTGFVQGFLNSHINGFTDKSWSPQIAEQEKKDPPFEQSKEELKRNFRGRASGRDPSLPSHCKRKIDDVD